jgi:hypothetical protein
LQILFSPSDTNPNRHQEFFEKYCQRLIKFINHLLDVINKYANPAQNDLDKPLINVAEIAKEKLAAICAEVEFTPAAAKRIFLDLANTGDSGASKKLQELLTDDCEKILIAFLELLHTATQPRASELHQFIKEKFEASPVVFVPLYPSARAAEWCLKYLSLKANTSDIPDALKKASEQLGFGGDLSGIRFTYLATIKKLDTWRKPISDAIKILAPEENKQKKQEPAVAEAWANFSFLPKTSIVDTEEKPTSKSTTNSLSLSMN